MLQEYQQSAQSPLKAGAASSVPDGRFCSGSSPLRRARKVWIRSGLLAVLTCGCLAGWGYYLQKSETIESLDWRCRELNSQRQWDQLKRVAERLSLKQPDKADPWLYRAAAAEGLKDWPNAVKFLDRVPRSDPRAISSLIQKASIEFESLNEPLASVRTCDEVLELDPRVLIAHKQTIFFYAMTLQRAEMVRRIRQAIDVRRDSPESYVYLVSASWLYSGSLYRLNSRWLENDPDNETYQVARALQVYTSQAKADLERAAEFEHIPQPEDLLKKYPQNHELIAYFLNKSITEGELDRVEELLQTLTPEQISRDPRFLRALAWRQDANNELLQAEQSLRQAHALDPYWWQIHFQLHDILRRRGQADESARFFEIYRKAKDLSTEIMTLNQSIENLDHTRFCQSLIGLAELVGDTQVVSLLRERVSPS